MNKELIIGLLVLCFLGACQGDNSPSKASSTIKLKTAQYTVQGSRNILPDIDKSMRLPASLNEISGLSFDASANVLIGHNDELGVLYFIDFESGKIKSELKIAGKGDYEGVEKVGDKIYLITSDGKLIEHAVGQEGSTQKSTEINAINNAEGLSYFNNQLLIACKGKAELNEFQDFHGCRSIYNYSIFNSRLNKNPFLLVNYAMLEASFKGGPSLTEAKRLNDFAPSAIAIHPKTQDFYILSFSGRLLVVCSQQATVKKVYFLDEADHRQPEGICFDTQDRLYIANEGNKGKPVIHRYQF